jgi:hypothetical protein
MTVVSDVYLPQETFERLRDKFNRGYSARKYGFSYEELLEIVRPENCRPLSDLQTLLRCTREYASVFYERWFGPLFPQCRNAMDRKKFITKILQNDRQIDRNENSLTESLAIIKNAVVNKRLTFELLPTDTKNGFLINEVMLEGKLCKIFTRNSVLSVFNSQYIPFSTNLDVLKYYDYVIIVVRNPSRKDTLYVIPTSVLYENRYENSFQQSYYIRLSRRRSNAENFARRAQIDWNSYKNNFGQLKSKRPA